MELTNMVPIAKWDVKLMNYLWKVRLSRVDYMAKY